VIVVKLLDVKNVERLEGDFKMNKQKQAIKEFEFIRENAELKALSGISLERPLTDSEFERFKELGNKYLNTNERREK